MKKLLLVMLVIAMVLVPVLSGCTPAEAPAADQAQEAADEPAQEAADEPAAETPKKLLMGMAIRSLTNPYYLQLQEGAEMFKDYVASMGYDVELQLLVSDGSDEKQINDIKAFVTNQSDETDCILYVDPNQAPNAAAIAEICEEAGVYWTTTWSTAEGLTPLAYKYYVVHNTLDDQTSGYNIATAMFEQFDTPGEGKILAIQGMLANSAAINRFKGLQTALAEYPGVELLDDQPADWDPSLALEITETWLATYDDIDGIWVANDSMALAVIEALKAKDLVGVVKVVGVDGIPDAVTAIQNGEMTATVSSNAQMQGGFSLAYSFAALTGALDTEAMTLEETMFLTDGILITGASVEDYLGAELALDFSDLSNFYSKPLPQ